MPNRRKTVTELARELRGNPTESEELLWEVLRKRRLGGYRFLRQKPFIYNQTYKKRYFFIADFYCSEKKLVIELDGRIHEYQKYYDYQRDLILQEFDLKTLRISNEQLADMDAVKKMILGNLEEIDFYRVFRTHPPAPSLSRPDCSRDKEGVTLLRYSCF